MKKQNFLKGSLILMISAVLAKALGALFKIPLTNMLGGVGMSYFSCAYSLFLPVYALTVTGLSSAVAKLTAQSAALGMYKNAERVRKTALLLFSAVGAAGSILTAVLAKPFCIYGADCPEAAAAVTMIAPAVFFGCITAVERGYYEGMSNMYPTALSQLAEGVIKTAAGLLLCGYVYENSGDVLAFFPDGTDIRAVAAAAGVLGVTLSSVGAALFLGVVRLFNRKTSSKGEQAVMSRREISKQLTAIALPAGLSAVVTNLTSIIDMGTIIGCISCFGAGKTAVPLSASAEELPHFIYGSFAGIALTVFNLVPSVTNMLGKGILPSVTEAWAGGNRELLKKRASQALLTTAIIAVPMAFGMGVLSDELLHFLFPHQPEEVTVCVNSLRLLMPGMVCLCLTFPLFSMLQAIGKASAPLKIMTAGAFVKLAGNLLLIPFAGIDGAAMSTSLCYIIILAVTIAVFLGETGVRLALKPFFSVLYAGALCGGAAFLTSDILAAKGITGTAALILSAAAGGVVYVLALFLSAEELFSAEREGKTSHLSKQNIRSAA